MTQVQSSPSIRSLQRPLSYHPDWGAQVQPGTTQYIVINPMHVVTLRDRSRTFAVRCVEKIKEFSEKWFTHILLLLLLMGYAALGAVIFQWLEGPLEDREKMAIETMREDIIHKLRLARSEERFMILAHKHLKTYEAQLLAAYSAGIHTDSDNRQWTFWGAMFYCGTVFTTIGYGNICPNTDAGRAATILYSFIGIPIMLMVLADLGKLFTRCIKYVFNVCRQFYYTGKCRRVRRAGKKATAPVQYIAVAWRNMPDIPAKLRRNSKGNVIDDDVDEKAANKKKADLEAANKEFQKPDDKSGKDLELDKEKEKSKSKMKLMIPEPDPQNQVQPPLIGPESPSILEEPPPFEVDDEFNLPISLALILLVAYINFGAFLFTLWEDWSFFEAVYFVFISMSTIGFGDYVPEHPMFMMATFIYLLFGLALTSMCINVVQEKLSDVFEAAKMRLGTTMGLDVNAVMAADALNNGAIMNGEEEGKKGELTDAQGRRKSKSAKGGKDDQVVVASKNDIKIETKKDNGTPKTAV